MAEAHRLRHLQVGEAGQDHFDVLLGDVEQRLLQVDQQRADQVDLAAQPQAHVGGDLVVAAAAGVQPLAGVADQLGQAGLDIQVHVFQVELPLEAGRIRFPARSAPCPLSIAARSCGGDDALARPASPACASEPSMSACHSRLSKNTLAV